MQTNMESTPQPCSLLIGMLEVRYGAHNMSQIGRSLSHLSTDIAPYIPLTGKGRRELLSGSGAGLLKYHRDDSPDQWWVPEPSSLSSPLHFQSEYRRLSKADSWFILMTDSDARFYVTVCRVQSLSSML